MRQDTSAEHIFEYFVYSLGLSACLRVESGAEREFGSKGFLELLLESCGELHASVRHNLLGNSMKDPNRLNVEASQLVAPVGGVDRNEMRHLS